jgi:two-component system sensor kinase FixL
MKGRMADNAILEFLEIAPGIMLELDLEGKVVLINEAGAALLGYSPDELTNKNWFDTCIPPHSRQKVETVFDMLLEDEDGAATYYENSVLTRSGEEKLVVWRNKLLRNDDGEVTGAVSFGEDVSHQGRAEEALRDSEAKIRAIVETAVDAIITIDEDGTIQSVNSSVEKLFGYTSNELLGQNVSMMMPHPYRDEHDIYLENYKRSGERKIIGIGREILAKKKDGSVFPIKLSVSEFFVRGRRMFTGMIHDMTEQKHLQDQIVRSERLAVIGKMAAKVAHEVRNPLSSISLNAELLEDEIGGMDPEIAEEATNLIQAIIKEIDRVTLLTEEYLQFSRLPESRPSPGTYDELLEEILEFLEPELQQKKIQYVLKRSTSGFRVRLDRIQFRRVLLNIIRNAIESMPDGGTLSVSTEMNTDIGILSIQDTGIGIPEDKVLNVFDPFFTTKDFGTGLGLAITEQVVHEHGGQIFCDSELGCGTTFRIELPIV